MNALLKLALTAAASSVVFSVASCGQHAPTQMPAPSPPGSTGPLSRAADWQHLGESVEGRPIRAVMLGHGSRRVLFIGGVHGDEQEGAYSTARLPTAFTAAQLEKTVSLTIVEDLNPDGRAAFTRSNANGVDINRNFPASNFDTQEPASGGVPLNQPESRLLFDLIMRTNPELVLVVHSWEGKQFVNYDGPARLVAERFARECGMPLIPSTEFSPTPGSLGSYFGRDRNTAVVTIEFLRGSDPEANWHQIEPALLSVIAG